MTHKCAYFGCWMRLYPQNSSRDSPWNWIPQLLVLSAQTGSWTWKLLSTGYEKRKWYFLCLIEGLMIRGVTSSLQIKPITCHYFKIQPLGCREPARKVGDKLSRKVTVKSLKSVFKKYICWQLGFVQHLSAIWILNFRSQNIALVRKLKEVEIEDDECGEFVIDV